MNKLHIHERICTSCSERVSKCVHWCSQHLSNVHTCTCMMLSTPVEMRTTLSAKNAYALVHVRTCNGAEASLPWKLLRTYLESCASIVQAVVCRPFLPPPSAVSTKPVARRCSLKKSVQIHASSEVAWSGRCCGVAQASFDHPRWCSSFFWAIVCKTIILSIVELFERGMALKQHDCMGRIFFKLGSSRSIARVKKLNKINWRHGKVKSWDAALVTFSTKQNKKNGKGPGDVLS